MDKPPVEEVITVSALADHLAALGDGAENPSYKSAFKDAADAIRILSKPKKRGSPLRDPALEAHGYGTSLDEEAGEMRLIFYKESGGRGVMGYMHLDGPGCYEVASDLLRQYDILEGVK
jgi:hypothetical protein